MGSIENTDFDPLANPSEKSDPSVAASLPGKFLDSLVAAAFATASAVAMIGWLVALGWVGIQTAEWLLDAALSV